MKTLDFGLSTNKDDVVRRGSNRPPGARDAQGRARRDARSPCLGPPRSLPRPGNKARFLFDGHGEALYSPNRSGRDDRYG
jgi:hypothetical protein